MFSFKSIFKRKEEGINEKRIDEEGIDEEGIDEEGINEEKLYIKEINEIVLKYDYFKLSIYNKNENKYILDYFIDDIKNILIKFKQKNFPFFILSFISLLYKFENFEIIETINSGANNDNILIASYKKNQNDYKIIIKIQNLITTINKDPIINEILTASIFLLIGTKIDTSLKKLIDIHTIDLGISYISYYKKNWNYNEITNFKSSNSPYKFDKDLTQFKLCHVYISHFIEGQTLYSLYEKVYIGQKIEDFILNEKFINLYNFLINIGNNYGYYHRDLHMGNIIYSIKGKEFVIIDYGRTTFNIENEKLINAVNKITQYQMYKLMNIKNDELTYETIINNNDIYYKYKNLFIFDIISYSLNIYLFYRFNYPKFYNTIERKLFKITFYNLKNFKIKFIFKSIFTYKIITYIENLKRIYLEIRRQNTSTNLTYVLDAIIFFCLTNIDNDLFNCENLFLYYPYDKSDTERFLKIFDIFIEMFNKDEKEYLAETNPLFAYLFNIQKGGAKKRRYRNSKFKSFLD